MWPCWLYHLQLLPPGHLHFLPPSSPSASPSLRLLLIHLQRQYENIVCRCWLLTLFYWLLLLELLLRPCSKTCSVFFFCFYLHNYWISDFFLDGTVLSISFCNCGVEAKQQQKPSSNSSSSSKSSSSSSNRSTPPNRPWNHARAQRQNKQWLISHSTHSPVQLWPRTTSMLPACVRVCVSACVCVCESACAAATNWYCFGLEIEGGVERCFFNIA